MYYFIVLRLNFLNLGDIWKMFKYSIDIEGFLLEIFFFEVIIVL